MGDVGDKEGMQDGEKMPSPGLSVKRIDQKSSERIFRIDGKNLSNSESVTPSFLSSTSLAWLAVIAIELIFLLYYLILRK